MKKSHYARRLRVIEKLTLEIDALEVVGIVNLNPVALRELNRLKYERASILKNMGQVTAHDARRAIAPVAPYKLND